MNPERAAALALTVSLAAILALGLWLLRTAPKEQQTAAVAPTLILPEPAAPTATVGVSGPPPAARGYRLAGTVVGDMTYAIIEDPRGANQLYRPGQSVPGLGQITAIGADSITLAGNDGSYALQLAPAPTLTPTVQRPDFSGGRLPPMFTPVPRPTRDQSGSESSP
jgi:hypothetical protein